MSNDQIKELALELLRADRENQVIELLQDAGYWENPDVWRPYGDRTGNFATIGNQQSRPEASLVEKIVNSVDARLMNECLCAGIDPESAQAPQSIREAVSRFFEGRQQNGEIGGKLQEWHSKRRTEEAKHITLAATGPRRNPCLTISDAGEGQTPNKMPETLLSIDRDNKLRIPFVQGKFNMGGTGALKFSGENSFQLIITKRNPEIVLSLKDEDKSAPYWSFAIVRRERPRRGIGAVRNSVYTYLAPVGAGEKPGRGKALRFQADALPLMTRYNEPYVREIQWGTAVKLYNYDMKGFGSHILMKDGLLYRLEALLPEIALPVSLHECRGFEGKKEASFVTTLSGLKVRLEEGRGGNLEDGFPDSVPYVIHGQEMVAQIYAFKKGRAETYRTNEGVLFSINGQTHGYIPKTIFQRSSVRMGRLADSLLVMVDCSSISADAREDLFMNSRDRLSQGSLRKAVERQIEEILHRHHGLRQLREVRQEQEIADRLKDSKPLEDVLESILKASPSLASIFIRGERLSQPHKPRPAGTGNGRENGSKEGKGRFFGKAHPTYFRFEKKQYGALLVRNCELGRRCRITFETDVENSYFSRPILPGRYNVEVIEGCSEVGDINHSLILHDGFAHWSVELPDDAEIGDSITLQCTVADEVIPEPFTNIAKLRIRANVAHPDGDGVRRSRKGKGKKSGNTNRPGIRMPRIEKIREDKWQEHEFDKYSGCKIIEDEVEIDGKEESEYTFYINVDNIYLRTDMKNGKYDPALVEAKFVYGNVLIGLALIHDEVERKKGSNNESNAENSEETSLDKYVRRTTKALAPFIVPMIDSLGSLTDEDVVSLAQIGDSE